MYHGTEDGHWMALLEILKKQQISSVPPSGGCPKYFMFSVFIFHINFVVGAKEIFNKLFKTSLIFIPYRLYGMHVYCGRGHLWVWKILTNKRLIYLGRNVNPSLFHLFSWVGFKTFNIEGLQYCNLALKWPN